ncbi:hypothetical protein KEM48_011380 [Puccinia striiformis f. sp. tritici PST-130]|nr:hypothetical protein KEM48_011380 [Puccinia striiformis f. sp. tritici PST-130]
MATNHPGNNPGSSALSSDQEQSELLRIWSNNLRFPLAAQPEIIRADQKDAYFINLLQDQIEPIVRAIKGSRWVNNNLTKLQEASKLIYLSLTTLPGEEYCDIIQFDGFQNTLPTLYRRVILIIIEVFSPQLFTKVYKSVQGKIARRIQVQSTSTDSGDNHSPRDLCLDLLKKKLHLILSYLPDSLDRSTLDSFNALHLSVFYLTGRYFTWSKRFGGITYISDRPRPLRQDGLGRVSPPSYEVLGVLMMIQLIVKVVGSHQQAKRRREQLRLASEPVVMASVQEEKQSKQQNSKRVLTVDGRLIDEMILVPEEDDDNIVDNHDDYEEEKLDEGEILDDCPEGVLIDNLSDQVSTRRFSWVKEKPECPLCRHSVYVAELLPLYNF